VNCLWQVFVLTVAFLAIRQAHPNGDGRAVLKQLVVGNQQAAIRAFYEPAYDLAWVRGDRPTGQAYALIQAFRSAATKGLNPDDCSDLQDCPVCILPSLDLQL